MPGLIDLTIWARWKKAGRGRFDQVWQLPLVSLHQTVPNGLEPLHQSQIALPMTTARSRDGS
jgi:hypothetical protein